jgi:hypothetical protein
LNSDMSNVVQGAVSLTNIDLMLKHSRRRGRRELGHFLEKASCDMLEDILVRN